MSQSTEVRTAIAGWAEHVPKVRRVWVFDRRVPHDSHARVDVALELEPVPDGEETIAAWIANADRWSHELGQRTGLTVGLEWIDPNAETQETRTILDEPKVLVYERTGTSPKNPNR